MGVCAFWQKFYCFPRLSDRIFDAAFIEVSVRQVFARHFIVRSNGQGMLPEGLAVGPISCLNPRRPSQRNQSGHTERTDNHTSLPPGFGRIGNGPREDQTKADLWKVIVAISVGLNAD